MRSRFVTTSAAIFMALTFTAGIARAQINDQDKDFLKDTTQDSNFEIKTGQLALQKSKSADIKAYANMLIHDHTQLEQQLKSAYTVTKVDPPSAGSMSVSDTARYAELKLLTGDTFDSTYIKGLVKGNQEAVDKTKSEAANSSVPAVKKIAQRRAELDTKHTKRAELLAQTHHIDAH